MSNNSRAIESGQSDFVSVTETWGLPASPEQLAMAYFRYRMAAGLAPGGRVLEVGCGTGMGLAYLSENAGEAVGCDISEELLSQARSRLPGLELVNAPASDLPFADASFDLVAMLEMIYYVPDQESVVAEAARVLRPGGTLMVCLPNRDRPAFNPSPLSTQYPDVPTLAALLERAGLQVTVYGAFGAAPASRSERRLDRLRAIAVRLHLVPRSMRAKALVKRILYGRLPRLDAIHDGMAEIPDPVELDHKRRSGDFKNLYAVGRKS